MRFRPGSAKTTTFWLLLILFWIALTLDNLRRDRMHHDIGQAHFHEVLLLVWVVIAFLHLYLYFFGYIELEPSSLFLRHGLWGPRIPYGNIVAVRPAETAKGKPIPHQIEIETAALSPGIYPHQYRRLAVADPRALAANLREKAPHAEYEFE
ncbi:MAG TPA: hypothetical protein VMD97_13240 [Candidatus Aquilonibacter sp.]|nr:hypothetical protein [Candidatus Aquilonibacter sp.]